MSSRALLAAPALSSGALLFVVRSFHYRARARSPHTRIAHIHTHAHTAATTSLPAISPPPPPPSPTTSATTPRLSLSVARGARQVRKLASLPLTRVQALTICITLDVCILSSHVTETEKERERETRHSRDPPVRRLALDCARESERALARARRQRERGLLHLVR